MANPDSLPSEYVLDSDDVIAEVSPAFLAFAQENDAPGLTASALIGAPIWNFVAGTPTREIYAACFERVRSTLRTVTLPFRCDSPTCRRIMELTVVPGAEQSIRLSAVLLRAETRLAVPLLDPRIERSGEILEACSFCRRIRIDDATWLDVEEAVGRLGLFDSPQLPMLSHGVCPACLPELQRRLGLG